MLVKGAPGRLPYFCQVPPFLCFIINGASVRIYDSQGHFYQSPLPLIFLGVLVIQPLIIQMTHIHWCLCMCVTRLKESWPQITWLKFQLTILWVLWNSAHSMHLCKCMLICLPLSSLKSLIKWYDMSLKSMIKMVWCDREIMHFL